MGRTDSDIGRLRTGTLRLQCWMGGGKSSDRSDIRIRPRTRILSLRSLRFDSPALVLQRLSWGILIWTNAGSWIVDSRRPDCTPFSRCRNYWNRYGDRLACLGRPESRSNHLYGTEHFCTRLGRRSLHHRQGAESLSYYRITTQELQRPRREPNRPNPSRFRRSTIR